MEALRILALVGGLFVLGCEKPSPPAPNPPAPKPLSTSEHQLPAPGLLRLSAGTLPADLEADFPPGSPPGPHVLTLEYAGPKTRLGMTTEFWSKGKKIGTNDGTQSISPPLSDVAVLGLVERLDSDGHPLIMTRESIPTKSGASYRGRITAMNALGELSSLKDRRILTFNPRLPLEIKDGEEAVVWGVFVDESEGASSSSRPEERAARSEAAWIFRMGPKDEKEK